MIQRLKVLELYPWLQLKIYEAILSETSAGSKLEPVWELEPGFVDGFKIGDPIHLHPSFQC